MAFLDNIVLKANRMIFEYENVITFLKNRGLIEDDIIKYYIGYTRVLNLKEEDSADYKYFVKKTNNFNLLYNKVIFPLHNLMGKVTGLCLRKIEVKEYDLVFSVEAQKMGAFFGLIQALPYIRKNNRVFVHEGAINSISFSIVYPESVASLTSYLSEPQYELLTLLCSKIIIIFDNDKAGIEGLRKVIKRYGRSCIDYLLLDDERDVNDYLRYLGREKFKEYIKKRIE